MVGKFQAKSFGVAILHWKTYSLETVTGIVSNSNVFCFCF